MDKLTKQLRANLLANAAVQIKDFSIWYLPVLPFDVAFRRVRKAKMDILMKMMMLAFEEASIRRAANLSEILLVEELFIADFMDKMERTGLIQKDNAIYKLTGKGQAQLETGIMEEELEEERTVLFYSPSHAACWPKHVVTMPEKDEASKEYRYVNQQHGINAEQIFQVLSDNYNGLDENGLQTVVADVLGLEPQTVERVPCIEFRLYNREQDMFYARVWNTMLGKWDDTLEKQIEEQERVTWQEK